MLTTTDFPAHAVAIVGLAGRFPGASNLQAFWANLAAGVESLQEFGNAELEAAGVPPEVHSQTGYVKRGTVLEGADLFDAGFFGLSPREAQILDPQQRIFLECAWEALEHAGYAAGSIDVAVGVYAGASMNTYLFTQILRDPALLAAVGGYQVMLGNDKDFLCTRASYKLDLHGPSMTVQTACSTSLVAVQVACRALERHECDMAIAGGVSVGFPQCGGYLYQEGMIFSPDGHCRPFDAAAHGTRSGAGCGLVVLKRLTDALADGDTVHAVIRGAAINNDGAGKAGYTAPSVDGQVEVIATAQLLAGVAPRSISYVEAHGTATPLGDPIEIAALTQAFRAGTADTGFCRLGSLKANLGHLDAAAGVAGLIKTVLALQARMLPPLVNFRTPNPQLELATSPFVASAQASPWPEGDTPRRAGVSSFGIGGTNAHVVLEEAPPVDPGVPETGPQLLLLSARSEAALAAAGERLAAHLQANPGQRLDDVAWTLQAGRRAFAHRRAWVADDAAQALSGLRGAASALHDGGARPVAFLFSGQGSQFAGMGAELYAREPVFRARIDAAAEILRTPLGLDLREVLHAPSGDTRIDETWLTQPALFATEVALVALWRSWGVEPAAMLGHSIGEYVAAHVAGVMSFEDGLLLVAERGRLMQSMPAGAMAAVHLPADELTRRLATWNGAVEIAAINAPALCTIAAPHAVLDEALARLVAAGVDTRKLHTSHAFHSASMDPIMAAFAERVAGVRLATPTRRYVSNLSGSWVTDEQATSPAYWAEHLRHAVHFEDGVRTLGADPALHLLEVGPGQALSTMARLTLGKDGPRRVSTSLPMPRDAVAAAGHEQRGLLEAAARLWLAGVPLDWRGLHAPQRPRRVPLPTYPFERKRHWVDAVAAPAAAPAATSDAAAAMPRLSPVDSLYAPTWQRDDAPLARAPRLAGTWIVAGARDALAAAVVRAVQDAGATVLQVDHGPAFERDGAQARIRLGRVEDVVALSREQRQVQAPVAGVITLWGMQGTGTTPAQLLPALYHATAAFGAGVGASPQSPVRLVVACAGAHAVLDEAAARPGAVVAFGPVLSLPQEVPGLAARLVDVEARREALDVTVAAARLVAEAAAADAENLSAWRAGRRWVRRYEHVALPGAADDESPIPSGGVVLVTGGLGGMGLALARHLAERRRARLLLTGRTAVPPREAWDAHVAQQGLADRTSQVIDTLRAIEAAGGEFIVAVADATDAVAMGAAIDQARGRWGRIDALVHAAGVPGGGHLAGMKSAREVEATLVPKVVGWDVLRDLLGDTPLSCVVLTGSISAVRGSAALADYSAANACLDAFVDSAQKPHAWRHVVAIDWEAWGEVGMLAKVDVPAARRSVWQAYLRGAIGTREGLEAFDRILASGRQRIVVTTYDLALALAPARSGLGEAREASAAKAAVAAPAAADAPPENEAETPAASAPVAFTAPDGEIEKALAAIWIELLGVERVDANDDFFALGGHSLLATRVLARLDEAMGARLALRDVFEAPTLRMLAQRIAALRAPDEDREEIEF